MLSVYYGSVVSTPSSSNPHEIDPLCSAMFMRPTGFWSSPPLTREQDRVLPYMHMPRKQVTKVILRSCFLVHTPAWDWWPCNTWFWTVIGQTRVYWSSLVIRILLFDGNTISLQFVRLWSFKPCKPCCRWRFPIARIILRGCYDNGGATAVTWWLIRTFVTLHDQ